MKQKKFPDNLTQRYSRKKITAYNLLSYYICNWRSCIKF